MKQTNKLKERGVCTMKNTDKMTNVKALVFVKENCELPEDVSAKIDAMIASFEKKAANKKATKTQEENAGIKEVIKSVLTSEGATVSEIQTKDIVLADLSNQKISALLRQMVESGDVVKTVDKKKSFFSLA